MQSPFERLPMTADTAPRVASARPEMSATLMAETGLSEDVLRTLVHRLPCSRSCAGP